MNDDLIPEAKELFLAAADLPAAERSTFVDASCGDDEELRRMVHGLLRRDAAGAAMAPDRDPAVREISRFEILEKIGAGGMGEVYRARDPRLDRDVAVKILPPDVAASPARRARFLREARLAAALSHPNIATVFEADEADGQLYYAMELIAGDTLDRRVRPGGLERDELLELALPLAEALSEAHRHGVLHLDLKPGNVMIDARGQLKVLDFGLSRRVAATDAAAAAAGRDAPPRPRQIVGTPAYMSPEQARGVEPDTRSDLFSLGAMLYELATGVRPFGGDSPTEVLQSVVSVEPVPVARQNPRTGEHLGGVVMRLLAKDPGDRPASADDLVDELRALRDRTLRPAASRKVAWTLAVAALVALVGLVGLVAALARGGDDRGVGPVRIAVLPFENLGAAEDAYFAAGVADAISVRLAGLRGLAVSSTRTAMRYRNSRRAPAAIAAEIGVEYLLLGSVERERRGDPSSRVRVTQRLVRPADGTQPWADTFELDAGAMFRVQAAIAEQVARALDVTLLAGDRQRLQHAPTASMPAYDFYLRGNDYRGQGFSAQNLRTAIRMYAWATELDPGFALAWAKLARCEIGMYWYRHDYRPERIDAARRALERARELDADHPQVRLASGVFHYHAHLDYDRALAEFEIARRAAPRDVELLSYIAFVHRRQGKFDRCIEQLELARAIDPRSETALRNLANAYVQAREHAKAGQTFDQLIAIVPEHPHAHAWKASALLFGRGDVRRARAALDVAFKVVENRDDVRLQLISIQTAIWAGDHERALRDIEARGLEAVLETPRRVVPVAALRALVHELMGNGEAARADHQTARTVIESMLADRPDDHALLSALGIALAGLGRAREAVEAGRRALERMPREADAVTHARRAVDLAHIHAAAGETRQAVELIEQLLAVPSELDRAALPLDPRWRSLRGEPRFAALTR